MTTALLPNTIQTPRARRTRETSEVRLRRAMRHLRRSGRRLVQRSDGWAVMSNGSVLARLLPEEVAFLAAEGVVIEAEGGGFVVTAAHMIEATTAPDAPAAGVWVFTAAGVPRTGGRGFEKLARKAQQGEGPLSLRQAAAGLRLIADAEQAARTTGLLTMDWNGIVSTRQRRSGQSGGLTSPARAASRRLERIRKAIGEEAYGLATAACIHRQPVQTIATRQCVTYRAIQKRLAEALEGAANVYEGKH